MLIDDKFEGGNITVCAIEEDCALLQVQLRDTMEDWFYWAFRVVGAAGRTVTFTFTDGPRVGYHGAAVSRDGLHWDWTHTAAADYASFTYTFASDDHEVYFCHDMRYGTAQFAALCARLGLQTKTLGVSARNRPIPYVSFGSGEKIMLFTSRHHACESTGTYLLEGVLKTLVDHVPEGFRVVAVPFVDMDGVVDGDQGKSRAPHDHNRDYTDAPLYAGVRALQQMGKSGRVALCIDLHSPWHFGGRHDVVHVVRSSGMAAAQAQFGRLLMARNAQHPAALRYDTANDLPFGVEWNTLTSTTSCAKWFALQPGVRLALSLECTYFGTEDNMVSQDKLVELGVCVAEAACDYLSVQAQEGEV